VGNVVDSKPSCLFTLNVVHVESIDFNALVNRGWNLIPQPIGETNWLLWWEVVILNTVKFMRCWGCMIEHKCRWDHYEAR
jgi:hypothetical protein